MKAAIIGLSGLSLTPAEEAMLHTQRPAGVILFRRNVSDPAQLKALTARLRSILPSEAALLVDQEGGRVARLRPPHWRSHPPAAVIGRLYEADKKAGLRAAWLTGALIGLDCMGAGFDVVCAPVLDLLVPGAHDIVGDRAYGTDPGTVTLLGGAVMEGLLAAGVRPVMKHVPGHGRAHADSHLELPVVPDELPAELEPFTRNAARFAGLPVWAMTAHILYEAWDRFRPATLSPVVIGQIIRQRIGFNGLLVSDDIAMKALSGDPVSLTRQTLAAGCDVVLHCTGVQAETQAVLEGCPLLTDQAHTLLAARPVASISIGDGESLAQERERLGLLEDGIRAKDPTEGHHPA
ncbi:Anhydromuramoyl-peptide exo-beta-N-acetylglucosaminidase [Granulibacter bethesdensis]|uniref:beta-N-acetylhexosaminidase n=1 Tax=Granulibacter bethesdensis TaxID=364410 RepID=A0AAN0RDW0_9PROT|nr:beta-N-acetylhexosaminidase [Granulibacter bethesdensis]AHJ63063.1 Anhydromuramoyl-peptide exo-beta-N-acetylglucosaminidase [Granulibacter bethesdensis]